MRKSEEESRRQGERERNKRDKQRRLDEITDKREQRREVKRRDCREKAKERGRLHKTVWTVGGLHAFFEALINQPCSMFFYKEIPGSSTAAAAATTRKNKRRDSDGCLSAGWTMVAVGSGSGADANQAQTEAWKTAGKGRRDAGDEKESRRDEDDFYI